ncbi:hypothetical protein G5C51_32525 [Streptomyces sp. A7024]|uniref:Uncharacterized protein n=1 Tax=Streptomyces coryli TaxID=1128680 RepID=A0A6G4UBA3_9ACTN|nr:hypothetical protein [Streptomyces coryli]NGN68607.1 hypothetical protein [Streptomyces coryli]
MSAPEGAGGRGWRIEWWIRIVFGLSALATAALAYRYHAQEQAEALHTQRAGWAPALLAAVLAALGGAAVLIRPQLGTAKRCWLMSAVAAVVFALGTGTVWQLVSGDDRTDTIVGAPLMKPADADRYVREELGPKPVRKIPTGVFIQGVKLTGPEEVQVNGYVWQHYDESVPRTSQGVAFPEAPDGYAGKEVYSFRRADGRLTKGWHFNLTLRQRFDYHRYPLDKQNVWLRMWTTSAFEREVLVPDLAGYPPWKPHAKYGLDEDIVSAGWSPYYTAFSYARHNYNITFGGADYRPGGSSGATELYYNIGVSRLYKGPLIGKLLQSTFIAVVMFMALFVHTRDAKKHPRFGFSTWTAISFAVSLLLVIVVDQTDVREITGDTSMTYLEYFAIAQYILITGIFANAILLGSDTRVPPLEWRDNLLPRLLYWPILTGLFFAFTMLVFAFD